MSLEIHITKNLKNFRLHVNFSSRSDRIGILGASGSGKSMTLKCIAGIETPDEGMIRTPDHVFFDSAAKRNRKPQQRSVGYLFQNYALFPTMNAAQNIGAALKGTRAEKKKRVEELIERFRLSGLADRMPHELSGGQQQRVALARMLAAQPDVILLDEPFSALDVTLKDQMQREMQMLLEDFPGTVVLVSHSRDEIYRFSQEVLVLDQGEDLVCGRTRDIFERPVYREAARLTGCKNFSAVNRPDVRRDAHTYTIEAVDWGILLHLRNPVPEEVSCIGYRAHDLIPVWGARPDNSIRVAVAEQAHLPFEDKYYLLPEGDAAEKKPICWFVQRDRIPEIEQKGMPDYLQFSERKMMFLKEMENH